MRFHAEAQVPGTCFDGIPASLLLTVIVRYIFETYEAQRVHSLAGRMEVLTMLGCDYARGERLQDLIDYADHRLRKSSLEALAGSYLTIPYAV